MTTDETVDVRYGVAWGELSMNYWRARCRSDENMTERDELENSRGNAW